jgi:UDP:flavonoid glycosyltransferase YjiC (YdhE family)
VIEYCRLVRLLFSSGAGHSHIAPMLPLAVTAREQGHDVVFVTGPGATQYPESAGLPTVSIGEPIPDTFARYRERYDLDEMDQRSTDERLSHLMAHFMVGIGAAGRLDDMLAFVRDWTPDLVVSNLAERASVLAAVLSGIPYVMHAMGPPKSAAVMAEGWEVAGELARRYGLDALPSRDTVPYLDIWPAGLQPAGVEWEYPTRWPLRPENSLPVEGNRPEVLDRLPYSRTVYVTLGTTYNTRPGVLESMISALYGEELNVVVTIGRNGDRERFGPQPEHVRIEHFVPQERLLPHVDVVVCHAGSGTVLGALAHGVPLVVSPLATDQFDMAAQITDAHVGLRAEAHPPAIREAVHRVLADSSFRDSAALIGGQIRGMPAPADILDRLHSYTQSPRTPA